MDYNEKLTVLNLPVKQRYLESWMDYEYCMNIKKHWCENVDGLLYWQLYFQGAIYQTELYIVTKKMIRHGLSHITKEKI